MDEADHFSISEFTVPIQYWIRNDVSRLLLLTEAHFKVS